MQDVVDGLIELLYYSTYSLQLYKLYTKINNNIIAMYVHAISVFHNRLVQ